MPARGHSSICACSCRRRSLSSLEKGLQEPAVQGMGEMGAELPYLQAAHTVAVKAHQPQAGATGSPLDTCKTARVRRGDRWVHATRSAQHCGTAGSAVRVTEHPCPLYPSSRGPSPRGSQPWGKPCIATKEKASSSPPPPHHLAPGGQPGLGLIWSHPLAPAFLEELRDGLCARVSIGWFVSRCARL